MLNVSEDQIEVSLERSHIEVCNGMWESVWIVKHVKDVPAIEVDRRVTNKQRILFRF